MKVEYKEGCECCSVSSSSSSSVSSSSISSVASVTSVSASSISSVSSASESSVSESVCSCGDCVWFKTVTASSWTQGDGQGSGGDNCTSDCECTDPPPTGSGSNCDGYKTGTFGTDTILCYKCCKESESSESSLSSASESSASVCDCGCCITEDITGRLMDESGIKPCDLGNSATFTLSYKSGAKPSTGVSLGESVGSWWRGEVDYCNATLTVTVYCLEGYGGCDNLWTYAEEKTDTDNCILNISNGDINNHIRSGTSVSCTCDPLSVKLGAFAGVGSSDSGCCCSECDPLVASDCDFAFRLELTD